MLFSAAYRRNGRTALRIVLKCRNIRDPCRQPTKLEKTRRARQRGYIPARSSRGFARSSARHARRTVASDRRDHRPCRGRKSAARNRDHCAGRSGVPAMAPGPCTAARRTGAPARRGIARRQGRARPPGHDRSRQDRLGRPRRSAGDDRHLRLRGRPVAPALRPHHRQRTAQSPHDGAMASARPGRRHHRVQFSGRGVVVECGAGAGLRQSGDLEAVGEDAADRAGGAGAVRTRRRQGGQHPRRPLAPC